MQFSPFLRLGLLTLAITQYASASLVLVNPVEQSGTGLGAVFTVLTLNGEANSTFETGCVAPSDSGTTVTGCGFENNTVQAQFSTPSIAEVGVTDLSNLLIIFNASEPGNALEIQLNELVLTFYSSIDGDTSVHTLAEPEAFATTASGTGNSGYQFRLDEDQATAANTFVAANGGGAVRIGLGASVGCGDEEDAPACLEGGGEATGGLETFFVSSVSQDLGETPEIPEPGSMALMGTGLSALALYLRKLRN